MHGNRSKKPAKTLDKSISDSIIIEEENINVSYTFVYTTLMKNGIRSPKARKATKRKLAKEKLLKQKKLKNKTEEEIEIFEWILPCVFSSISKLWYSKSI